MDNRFYKFDEDNKPLMPILINLKVDYLSPKQMTYQFGMHLDGRPPEEFKVINLFGIAKNKYYISSYGRVFTINGRELRQELNPYMGEVPYLFTLLQHDRSEDSKKESKYLTHRLVALHFIPKSPIDIELERNSVNHKYNVSGVCNFVWNLEWCTPDENTKHSHLDLEYKYRDDNEYVALLFDKNNPADLAGANNPKAKFTERQVELICYDLFVTPNKYNYDEIAIRIGMQPSKQLRTSISSIKKGHAWRNISSRYIDWDTYNKFINENRLY